MATPLDRTRNGVCAIAARHAMAVDSDARFPAEAFAALRDARLMGVLVPHELGGEGATISEIASICHLLGRNCASTGLIYAMHLIQTACIVQHGRTAWHRDILHQAAAEQFLLASATTEAATGGDLGRSECAIRTEGSQFDIEKNGAVISYGDHADMVLVTTRRSPDAAATDQVLAVVPRRQFVLTRTAGWDALGMRGTCSNTYRFRGHGHTDQILPTPYGDIQNDTMTPFAHLTWSSVWLGIAVDALSRARLYLRGKPNATPAHTQLVQANATLQQMKADLTTAVRQYQAHLATPDRAVSFALLMMMNNLKITVSTGVVQIVQQALSICGIAGYRNDTPFSLGRHLRDALSAPVMVSNDRITAGMGKMLLVQRIDADLLATGENH
jgi:acyl-CoA dehydrogenase